MGLPLWMQWDLIRSRGKADKECQSLCAGLGWLELLERGKVLPTLAMNPLAKGRDCCGRWKGSGRCWE